MIDYEKIEEIITGPYKQYRQFTIEHEKRMEQLKKRYKELEEEYEHLLKIVYGTNTKMTCNE